LFTFEKVKNMKKRLKLANPYIDTIYLKFE